MVLLDGLLVDTWMEQVEVTVYWDRTQELDRAGLPSSYPPDVPPTRHTSESSSGSTPPASLSGIDPMVLNGSPGDVAGALC